jgi:hypothetical protein
MRYKFNVQSSILVAGLVAASYAQACYYNYTSAKCFNSGDPVDVVFWPDGTTPASTVVATADWYAIANNYKTGTGVGGYSSYTTASAPSWCGGPAKIKDPSGHFNALTEWENGAATVGSYSFSVTGQSWGTASGASCM